MVHDKKPLERRPANIILPVVLIAAGLLVFAANLGWLGWDGLLDVLQLWPLILIAVGADILSGGRYRLWLVLAALALGALLYAGVGSSVGLGIPPAQRIEIAQGLEGAERARVHLQVGAAELRVESAAGSSDLIEGTVQTGRGERVTQDFAVENGTARFALSSEQTAMSFRFGGRRTWDLTLTDRVPLELTVDSGVGAATLDLAELQLTSLELSTGVGSTTLTLPRRGRYEASLDTGVGAATVRIPTGVGARVEVSRGVGAVSVEGDFMREGDTYTSADYATAADRVDLRVSGGVGAITVQAGR